MVPISAFDLPWAIQSKTSASRAVIPSACRGLAELKSGLGLVRNQGNEIVGKTQKAYRREHNSSNMIKRKDRRGKRILHLNLHREHFAAIAAKTKRIEYRKRTPYWKKRLEGRQYDWIQFRNGYGTKEPEMLAKFCGLRRYGKGRNAYYAIQLGWILKIRRWNP
jgi:hypothetical protein